MEYVTIPNYKAVTPVGGQYYIGVAINHSDSTLRVIVDGREHIVQFSGYHHGRYYIRYGGKCKTSKHPISVGEAVEWLASLMGLTIIDQDKHLDLWMEEQH